MSLFDSIKNAFGKSQPDAKPGTTAKPEPEPAGAAGVPRTYTVVSGDTLWKIAERVYGDGSAYTRIFEANRDLLERPDQVYPGQELTLPEP